MSKTRTDRSHLLPLTVQHHDRCCLYPCRFLPVEPLFIPFAAGRHRQYFDKSQHPLCGEMGELLARQLRRSVRLPAIAAAALYGLWQHRKLRRDASPAECAEWLHQSCARGLSAIHVRLSSAGTLPVQGLIVSNHLGYLDILVMSAAVPCVFVSKAEVKRWPIFGRYARWAGSVFVRRHNRADAARANDSVTESLRMGSAGRPFSRGHHERRTKRPALSLHHVAARN